MSTCNESSHDIQPLEGINTCMNCGLETGLVMGCWYGMERTHMFINPELRNKQRLQKVDDFLQDYELTDARQQSVKYKCEELIKLFEGRKEELGRKTFPIITGVKKLMIEQGLLDYVPTRNDHKVFQWLNQLEMYK